MFVLGATLWLEGGEKELYGALAKDAIVTLRPRPARDDWERAAWANRGIEGYYPAGLGSRGTELRSASELTIARCSDELRATWGAAEECGYVPVAKRKVYEVTGVVQREREADVEFSWGWEVTPIGSALSIAGLEYSHLPPKYGPFDTDAIAQGRAHFSLYDDGWRVQSITW